MKFRRKPIVLEAIQFRANFRDAQTILNWINEASGWSPDKNTDPPAMYYYGDLTIMRPDGNLHARDKDWIIKGVKGEFYPCKPDVFKKTYEPVV